MHALHYMDRTDVKELPITDCKQLCLESDTCYSMDYTYYQGAGQCALSSTTKDKSPQDFIYSEKSVYYELTLFKGKIHMLCVNNDSSIHAIFCSVACF